MAVMYAMGACIGCRKLFMFNADLVPSIRISGIREPICQACVDRANPKRIENGLEPITVQPGAYEPEECA